MLKIYNSLTKTKELFKPINSNVVNLYVCGMTVYDYCHIGHARILLGFDMVVRYLRFSGYTVNYVRNITDVDDKIIKASSDTGKSISDLTNFFIESMNDDCQALDLLKPTQEPRATEYITEIIEMIGCLLQKGYAYLSDNGDVYYNVRCFENYGKLSGRNLDELRINISNNMSQAKHDQLDFALWKAAKPGEPKWKAPWGDGRPGWHIECSVMSAACLGDAVDIHGGGVDLIFPHHENEIAQSEGITGKKSVNYWMHMGQLQVEKAKMSKSLGNFITIRDFLNNSSAEVLRYFVLSSHYSSPINYTENVLQQTKQSLARLYTALRDISFDEEGSVDQKVVKEFKEVMNDDFNTPKALSILFNLAKEINILKENSTKRIKILANTLRKLGDVLGILKQSPEKFLQQGQHDISSDKIAEMIAMRNRARKEKNWVLADEIRDKLHKAGISLEDNNEGTKWRT